jgi:hypothetical protein
LAAEANLDAAGRCALASVLICQHGLSEVTCYLLLVPIYGSTQMDPSQSMQRPRSIMAAPSPPSPVVSERRAGRGGPLQALPLSEGRWQGVPGQWGRGRGRGRGRAAAATGSLGAVTTRRGQCAGTETVLGGVGRPY